MAFRSWVLWLLYSYRYPFHIFTIFIWVLCAYVAHSILVTAIANRTCWSCTNSKPLASTLYTVYIYDANAYQMPWNGLVMNWCRWCMRMLSILNFHHAAHKIICTTLCVCVCDICSYFILCDESHWAILYRHTRTHTYVHCMCDFYYNVALVRFVSSSSECPYLI